MSLRLAEINLNCQGALVLQIELNITPGTSIEVAPGAWRKVPLDLKAAAQMMLGVRGMRIPERRLVSCGSYQISGDKDTRYVFSVNLTPSEREALTRRKAPQTQTQEVR